MPRLRHCRVWMLVASLALVAACEVPPPEPPKRTPGPPEDVAACSRPTDTTRTGGRGHIGSLLEPTIGPLSFHIDVFSDRAPTKVIIRPRTHLSQPITLTGSRCSDGLPLLFWFAEGIPGRPTAGDASAVLEPVGPDVAYTGYLLFTTKGRWQATVAQNGARLGVLLIEVV